VATAPTPARAHGTTEPTEKYFDCTAQPTSPASRSAATIEKVPRESIRVIPFHGGAAPPAGATPLARPALCQPDARVDPCIEDVDHQVEHDDAGGREHDHPLRRRQVEVVDGADRQPPEPRQPVHALGEERTAEREPDVHAED